jgi:DNA mismatch repair protein MutS2
MGNIAPPVASGASLRALELDSLLAMVAQLAATDAGRRHLTSLQPTADGAELDSRREAYEEVRRLLGEGALIPTFEEDLWPAWEALATGSSSFGGEQLILLGAMLTAVAEAGRRIGSADPLCPRLAGRATRLEDLEPLRRRIRERLDRRGRVRDDASPKLTRLSATARGLRETLYKELHGLAERHREDLSDDTVPLHGGRLVLQLRSGSRGRVKGLTHGRSATGKSFYFEPLEVVERNNRFQEAQHEVEAERLRLLRELVDEARERVDGLAAHLEFVARLDGLQAAARFAESCGGRLADLAESPDLELVGARHPLLDPRLAALRESALGKSGHRSPAVPLHLRLEAGRRVLVITGPNAGGKTVALKTLGLLSLASACGLPVPVEAGTRIPIFERVVATVGDDQDLLQDRSTFSGRLLRLKEAWEAAGPGSLILLDELGSGTDPEEGAALAIALLEGLLARRAAGVITTHLVRLAAAALEAEGAFCAAMEFDGETGQPTYRLVAGAPGGSEAMALARRLELPGEWLDRAEELLGSGHRDLQRLLAEVERVREDLRAEVERGQREAAALAAERELFERRREELEAERRRVAKQHREELEAFRRKVASELGEAVDRMRGQLASGRRRDVATRAVEQLFEAAPPPPPVEAEEGKELPLEVGCVVEHRSLGWQGKLVRLERGRAEVVAGGKRFRCRAEELRRRRGTPAAIEHRPVVRLGVESEREESVEAELMLVGQRVEPALERLDAYLDRALRGARPEVRVIHGHGTGRLRDAVRDLLRRHPAVGGWRPGGPGEGGDGATVVTLGSGE